MASAVQVQRRPPWRPLSVITALRVVLGDASAAAAVAAAGERGLGCASLRCAGAGGVGEGGECCEADGSCAALLTRSGLVQQQLFCAQHRYDRVSEMLSAVLEGSEGEALAARMAALASGSEDVLADAWRSGAESARQHADFLRDGFVALRGALSQELVEAARESLETVVWNSDRMRRPGCVLEIAHVGAFRRNASVRLRAAPRWLRSRTYRLTGLHFGAEEPMAGPWNQIFYNSRILEVVQRLLGGPARLRQSLLFERGSQQDLHDDTWYLPAGSRPGGTLGVWVALDDADSANGQLHYVSGSHRRPEEALQPSESSRAERLLLPGAALVAPAEATQPEELVLRRALEASGQDSSHPRLDAFTARAGDVGLWHERLLHGGSRIRDWSRTRRSLVLHYVDA